MTATRVRALIAALVLTTVAGCGGAPSATPQGDGQHDVDAPDEAPAPPRGPCDVLADLVGTLQPLQETRRETAWRGPDQDAMPTTAATYLAVRDAYAEMVPLVGEDQRRGLEYRVARLDEVAAADPDAEGIPDMDTPELIDELEAVWHLPSWSLVPRNAMVTCEDHDPASRFLAVGSELDGEPRFESESVDDVLRFPFTSFLDSGEQGAFASRLAGHFILFEERGDIAAQHGGEVATSIVGRTRLSMGSAEWYVATHASGVELEDAAGQLIEFEVAGDEAWLAARLPDGVELDGDGIATFRTDDILGERRPLTVGEAQEVALVHDPTVPFGAAVSVPAGGSGDAREALMGLLETAGIRPA